MEIFLFVKVDLVVDMIYFIVHLHNLFFYTIPYNRGLGGFYGTLLSLDDLLKFHFFMMHPLLLEKRVHKVRNRCTSHVCGLDAGVDVV